MLSHGRNLSLVWNESRTWKRGRRRGWSAEGGMVKLPEAYAQGVHRARRGLAKDLMKVAVISLCIALAMRASPGDVADLVTLRR